MDKQDKHHITGQRGSGVDPGPDTEESRSGKKLDLSLAQVLGSAVAAVVAAFAAGQLGVYGTFLGAGVVSLVATSGGPIFQHFFSRTGKQIKEVTVPPKARRVPVQDPAPDWKDDQGDHTAQAVHNAESFSRTQAVQTVPGGLPERTARGGTGGAAHPASAGDATRAPELDQATRALSVDQVTHALRTGRPANRAGAPADDATRALRLPDAPPPADAGGKARPAEAGPDADTTRALPGDDATRVLGTVQRPMGTDGPGKLPGDGEFTDGTTHGTKWRGWRRTLLPAALVFVIAIGGITLYEALSGHSVSGGKGTSVSDVFRSGHGSSGDESPDAPPATPTPGHSGSGDSSTPTPEESQPSTDPGGQGGDRSEQPGSGNGGDKSTPTPDPSQSGPGATDGSGSEDTGSTPDDSGGSDSRQNDGGAGSDNGSGNAGTGSNKLPQGEQPGSDSQ